MADVRFVPKTDIGGEATMTNPDVRSVVALLGSYSSIVVQPRTVRMLRQRAVVVPILACNFGANPRRQFNLVIFIRQFDFGDNQTLVFTGKYVDFPAQIIVRNDMSDFLDDRAPPE
jgi:hypothetical protein